MEIYETTNETTKRQPRIKIPNPHLESKIQSYKLNKLLQSYKKRNEENENLETASENQLLDFEKIRQEVIAYIDLKLETSEIKSTENPFFSNFFPGKKLLPAFLKYVQQLFTNGTTNGKSIENISLIEMLKGIKPEDLRCMFLAPQGFKLNETEDKSIVDTISNTIKKHTVLTAILEVSAINLENLSNPDFLKELLSFYDIKKASDANPIHHLLIVAGLADMIVAETAKTLKNPAEQILYRLLTIDYSILHDFHEKWCGDVLHGGKTDEFKNAEMILYMKLVNKCFDEFINTVENTEDKKFLENLKHLILGMATQEFRDNELPKTDIVRQNIINKNIQNNGQQDLTVQIYDILNKLDHDFNLGQYLKINKLDNTFEVLPISEVEKLAYEDYEKAHLLSFISTMINCMEIYYKTDEKSEKIKSTLEIVPGAIRILLQNFRNYLKLAENDKTLKQILINNYDTITDFIDEICKKTSLITESLHKLPPEYSQQKVEKTVQEIQDLKTEMERIIGDEPN
jgi:hypothetical protein